MIVPSAAKPLKAAITTSSTVGSVTARSPPTNAGRLPPDETCSTVNSPASARAPCLSTAQAEMHWPVMSHCPRSSRVGRPPTFDLRAPASAGVAARVTTSSRAAASAADALPVADSPVLVHAVTHSRARRPGAWSGRTPRSIEALTPAVCAPGKGTRTLTRLVCSRGCEPAPMVSSRARCRRAGAFGPPAIASNTSEN